jgi:hypothetical protein
MTPQLNVVSLAAERRQMEERKAAPTYGPISNDKIAAARSHSLVV